MAASPTLLTSGASSVDGTSFVTASITPTANALVLLFVSFCRGSSVDPNFNPPVSGCGLTWELVLTANHYDGAGTDRYRLHVYRAMSASPSTGTVTISLSGTHSGAAWSIVQVTGVEQGANGATACVQKVFNSGTGTSGSVTLPNAFQAGSITLAGFAHEANEATTFGSGFTELSDNAHATPGNALEVEWVNAEDLVADASWATSTPWGGVSLEIAAAQPQDVDLEPAAEGDYARTLGHEVPVWARTQPSVSGSLIMPEFAVDWSPLTRATEEPVYESLTARVREVHVRVYRQNELDEFETGEMFVVCDNRDRALDPLNVASRWYPNVKTRRRIRFASRWDSAEYDRFTGFLRGLPQRFPGQKDTEVTLVAADYGLILNREPVTLNGFPREYVHERIERVLDLIGVPGFDRAIDESDCIAEGVADALPGTAPTVVGALDHCRQAAKSDGGYLFIGRSGLVTFHNRAHRRDNLATPLGTLSDQSGELRYFPDLTQQTDDSRLWNTAAVATWDGQREEVANEESAIDYFHSRKDDFSSVLAKPGDAAALASLTVWRYGVERSRIPAISAMVWNRDGVDPSPFLEADVGAAFDFVLTPEVGAPVELAVHVEGIREDIVRGQGYRIGYDLSPADVEIDEWLVGSSALGVDNGLGL